MEGRAAIAERFGGYGALVFGRLHRREATAAEVWAHINETHGRGRVAHLQTGGFAAAEGDDPAIQQWVVGSGAMCFALRRHRPSPHNPFARLDEWAVAELERSARKLFEIHPDLVRDPADDAPAWYLMRGPGTPLTRLFFGRLVTAADAAEYDGTLEVWQASNAEGRNHPRTVVGRSLAIARTDAEPAVMVNLSKNDRTRHAASTPMFKALGPGRPLYLVVASQS